jgi:hypothetical protein
MRLRRRIMVAGALALTFMAQSPPLTVPVPSPAPGPAGSIGGAWSLVPAARAQTPYQDGDLLQAEGDDKLHLLDGGRRRWIADSGTLQRLNLNARRLHRVAFDELDRIPVGRPHRQWPLLRDTASGRVYAIVQESQWRAPRRRWIADPETFERLGFDWSDVAVDWPDPVAEYADMAALTYRPVSRDLTTFGTAAGTFYTIPAWRLQVEDQRLLTALNVAATHNAEWRDQVGPRLAALGTWMEWGDLPPETVGRHHHGLNRITMSRALETESFGVLAAVLVHEASHATAEHGASTTACLAEEVQAFTWVAKTWASLPPQWRTQSAFADSLDRLVEDWRAQRLDQIVASEEAYQRQCARAAPAPAR